MGKIPLLPLILSAFVIYLYLNPSSHLLGDISHNSSIILEGNQTSVWKNENFSGIHIPQPPTNISAPGTIYNTDTLNTGDLLSS